MNPEQSEKLLINELFEQSVSKCNLSCNEIKNIERLTGDASTRKYYRIYCDQATYVVCLDNPAPRSLFVDTQSFFSSHLVRVPKVLDYDLSKGYILEEDLGDSTLLHLLSKIDSKSEELEVYKKVIDELVKIHSIEEEKIKKSKIITEAFDFKKLSSEIDFTVKYFLQSFLQESDPKLIDDIKSGFYEVCLRASEVEKVCTHRDFHSRNVMSKNEELIIIDFQDARMGLAQYDLASLLDDCYYELDDENKKVLKKYYFSQMNLQKDYQLFLEQYDDIALQRVFKAIGSFSYIYHYRKDFRYVKYIGFAMEKIKKILLQNARYKNLRKSLMGVYYDK
jgi:aminoglycoside/choline kinase family phosphotransferase